MQTKALVFIILALGTAFFWNWYLYTKPALPVNQSTQMRIIQELRQRSAGDCVITDGGDYWRCEEMATGKIFKVKK